MEGHSKPSRKYLNVLPNPAPVVCGHVGGVQERVVLQDSVDDSLVVFGQSGGEDHSVSALYRNTCEGPMRRMHKNKFQIPFGWFGILVSARSHPNGKETQDELVFNIFTRRHLLRIDLSVMADLLSVIIQTS